MKNSPFPIPAVFKRHFNQSNKLRAAVVLAAIALVSTLPFYTSAQRGAVRVKKSQAYTVAPGRGVYMLQAGPNGETVCRQATPAEARAMSNGTSGARHGLIQINHLKDDLSVESTTANLAIVLRATAQLDANVPAKNAFIAAAARWEALIKDPIIIAVDVDFGTTFFGDPFSGSDVLGATESPQFAFPGNYTDVRGRLVNHASPSELAIANALPATAVPTDRGSADTVFVTSPLLRALGIFPPDYLDDPPSQPIPAPRIGFNSDFNFDLDPSNGINSNQTDFDAVAVHEIGHLLGFNSQVGDQELNPGDDLTINIWDLFRFFPGTANLGNFSMAQRVLTSGPTPTTQHVQFNGGAELGLSTGKPDGTGGDGEQASHWKADEQSGTYLGIMDPTIARGVRETMTVNDQNAIDSFGYLIQASTGPPNDNFVDAQVITGTTGTIPGTNAFATKENGELSHSPDGNLGGKSVWYRWTAPSSGTATLTTEGSNYDTLLAVWTGSSVNALTSIIKNDDVDLGVIVTSSVQFPAVSGTTYQIAVDGFNADQGNISLNFTLPGGGTPTPSPTPGGPNTVQFSAATANVTETLNATAKVDLTVTRTGTTTGAATVNYATTDATASERSDYLAALGTLRFAANETTKAITVFIVNDSYGENPETFNITLSAPVGCTIGSPAAAAVTINSDESVPGTNGPNPVKDPNFDSDLFVREQYVDFFNREADPGGLGFWKNQIDSCPDQACREIRRINVSAAFFVSGEFQQTGYLVYKSYQAAFSSGEFLRLRDFLPDTQEIGRGVVIGQPGADALLEANTVRFFEDFVQRANFVAPAAYPTTMTADQFVDKLNANTFDPLVPGSTGSLTGDQRTALVNQLSANPSSPTLRAAVLRSVAQNSLFSSRQFNKAFVLMQYFGYMRRNPNDPPEFGLDFAGYNFWLGKLNDFNGNYISAEMVKAFITSGEYKLRFGPD